MFKTYDKKDRLSSESSEISHESSSSDDDDSDSSSSDGSMERYNMLHKKIKES